MTESIVRDSIVSYLENGQLLTSQQHGFMKGRSCLTNLLETFESGHMPCVKAMEMLLYFLIIASETDLQIVTVWNYGQGQTE